MKISWWEWLPFRRWRVIGTVEFPDEIPERLPRRAMVLVADGGPPKWVGFKCPCGQGHDVLLNLDQARRPAWSLAQSHTGSVTIAPSIDFLDGGRRCHFHMRNSKILWAKDSIR